tara:strand:+ start:258 stop:422 length:165 start_codon:yes stop_codon:yes gene_type:complete
MRGKSKKDWFLLYTNARNELMVLEILVFIDVRNKYKIFSIVEKGFEYRQIENNR